MNAVVLSFDRLHLGFLGCYGNSWIVTPNFDRLAAEAAVFDFHFGENFAPQAENHAWWTGRHQFPLSADQQRSQATFPYLLRQHGVRTQLVFESLTGDGREIQPTSLSNFPADAVAIQSSGFDRCTSVAGRDGLDVDEADMPIARLITQGIDELNRLAAEPDVPALLWLKSQGVPSPWIPPRLFSTLYLDEFLEVQDGPAEADAARSASAEDVSPAAEALLEGLSELLWSLESAVEEVEDSKHDAGRANSASDTDVRGEGDALGDSEWPLLRAIYAGYVTLLDRWLGKLLDGIDRLPPECRPLVIVTAASGQALGESRARRNGGVMLTEELVHTPLLIRLPNSRDGGIRRSELVQTIDLAPTLLDWFGVETDSFPCAGRSLLPEVGDRGRPEGVSPRQTPPQQVRECLFMGAEGRQYAIRTQGYYLVTDGIVGDDSGTVRLFDKPNDVWEIHDIADQSPDTAATLKSALSEFIKPFTTTDEASNDA